MQESNRYYDVVIKNNSYYIVESSKKPDSAVKTLAKIEKVLKNKMEYDTTHQASPVSLEYIANKVHTGYTQKQAKIHDSLRPLLSQEKKVASLHTRIENYIAPPSALPLLQDILNTIGSQLNSRDLGALSKLNRQGKKDTEPQILTRAQEYGYEGQDVNKARLYVEQLFSEVRKLGKLGVIGVRDEKLLNKNSYIESILNPKKASQSCVDLFGSEKFYQENFVNLYKYLSKCLREYPDPQLIKKINSSYHSLCLAVQNGRNDAANFLLDIGEDVNHRNNLHDTPLIISAKTKNRKMAELLIQRGANINARNNDGKTALMEAACIADGPILEILLENGADLTLLDNQGRTALWHASAYSYRGAKARDLLKKASQKI